MTKVMDLILSPRLSQLQEAIQNSHASALAEFWAEMARQTTPLIEPTGVGDYWVTFLWRADETSQSVAVIQDWGADQIREHQMAQPNCWPIAIYGMSYRPGDIPWITWSTAAVTILAAWSIPWLKF